ncbi:MAG: hypothetical protein ABI867_02085 [Kofleriaceae bacterium]
MTDVLLEQIAAAPDDDQPRLVWADAVGGERGELVVIQCELARGGLARDAAIARRQREAELLAQHAAEWTAGFAGLAQRPTFRRGFVERAFVDAAAFPEQADALVAAAPLLRELDVFGLQHGESSEELLGLLSRMLASPRFAMLTGLRFDRVGRTYERDSDMSPFVFESVGSGVLKLLVETGSLTHLRTLALRQCALGNQDLAALAASPDLAAIRELDVGFQQVENYVAVAGEGVRAILDSPYLAALEALDVADLLGTAAWTSFGRQGRDDQRRRALEQARLDVELFAHPRILGLRSLGLAACGLIEESIDALVAAPFSRLAKLDLSGNRVVAGSLARLGAAPGFAHLEDLATHTPSAWANVAGFPALKVLRLRGQNLAPDAVLDLLASPLAERLEVIDLRGNAGLGADLRELFDGLLLL